MAEYIEREALMKFPIRIDHYDKVNGNEHFVLGIESVLEYAENIPAADVVERKRGEWVDHCVRDWRCSVCGEPIKKVRNVDGYCYDDKPNFCPSCGADMRSHQNILCDQGERRDDE